MAKQDDGLFLLEVLIDKIVFVKSPCFSDKDFRTCVNIECPSVDPLEICDDDPGACVAKSGGPFVKTFNSGKSCLFSLKEADVNQAMNKFPIKICVYKSLPCGCLPTKIIMGEATIDMTKEFVQARKKFLEDPSNVSYQALKDSFRIVGPDGAETGEIVMFLRISCFGKLIVTKFQGAGGSPGLGTGGGSSTIVDRSCNPRKDFQTNQDPCACGAARGLGSSGGGGGAGGHPCTQGGGGGGRIGVCPIARDPYNSMPCEDPDDSCYCSGPKAAPKEQMDCRNTDPYCLHVPKDCCPTGNKVIFQIPSDSCGMAHKQRAHFSFTADGVGDVARDEPGQLMPTTAEDYPGVVYDFPKQVIKLRIGKTIEMPGRKSKLEYQFITPVVTHERVVPVMDTRTSQCLPCCPDCCQSKSTKRALPRLPFCQELTEETKLEIKKSIENAVNLHFEEHFVNTASKRGFSKVSFQENTVDRYPQVLMDGKKAPDTINEKNSVSSCNSNSTLSTIRTKKSSIFISSYDYISGLCSKSTDYINKDEESAQKSLFGKKETTVYMTLFDDSCCHRTSGTQATASINKCLQVSCNSTTDSQYTPTIRGSNSNYCSTCTLPSTSHRDNKSVAKKLHYSDVYFFGRKKSGPEEIKKGMGSSESISKPDSSKKKFKKKIENESKETSKSGAAVQVQSTHSSTTVQTDKTKETSAATSTGKTVSIKDDKSDKPCPAGPGTKGDMVATVSHIRIGPKEQCPVHGKEPCQGPKCILAASGEEQAPVKVTTVTNSRRGVFELVIRRMTGAPLAKNELMLEWTPPPSRPPPCGPPCPAPCTPPPCRPSKCKMIVCRPSPCKPKCCKKVCKKPCGPMPCRPVPCKKCCKSPCCGKPCRPCKPCPPPPRCRPCPPSLCKSPCAPPCCKTPCSSPCKSSPCLRPCPVGHRRARRARSQPRIKSHRKRISPCCNRSKACPVVRCRSVSGPCIECCGTLPCPPRKCCSVSPCQPPKCCKSSCSNCCV